jgi:hypothetical protein
MQKLKAKCAAVDILPVFLLLGIACQAGALAARRAPSEDLFGERFRCDDRSWVRLCLKVLKPGCRLSISPGEGLPREPDDRLVLIHAKEARVVTSFKDLMDCVEIHDEKDALEYLRFFSYYDTVYLLERQELEVFGSDDKKCFAVCLPSGRWKSLNLSDPIIVRSGNDFEVTRYLIRPTKVPHQVALFRVTQLVQVNGNVLELKSERIDITPEDSLRLYFPRFL